MLTPPCHPNPPIVFPGFTEKSFCGVFHLPDLETNIDFGIFPVTDWTLKLIAEFFEYLIESIDFNC
jgi:hypothetical protein